jgi:hypothetical protein
MKIEQNNLGTALDILSTILETGSISRTEHPREFMQYDQDPEVRNSLDFLAEKLDLLICEQDGTIYMSPGINNRIFSLSNTEIKRELGTGFGNNAMMYTAFFIMHIIITEFYKEATQETYRAKLSKMDLLDSIDRKVKSMMALENLENTSEQYHFNFKQISDSWNSLPQAERKDTSDELRQKGTSSKYSVVNQTVKFMKKQGLVVENDDAIYLTGRCKAIITEAYNRNEIQANISDFIEGLSDSKDGDDAPVT